MGQLSQISAPVEGLRALPVYQDLPFRAVIPLCQNDHSAPLVKQGEIVLVDEDCCPADGEMYLVEYPARRPWRRFAEREIVVAHQSPSGHWFTRHLASPPRPGVIVLSDGPYDSNGLIDMIVGRVVGIYDPCYARRAA